VIDWLIKVLQWIKPGIKDVIENENEIEGERKSKLKCCYKRYKRDIVIFNTTAIMNDEDFNCHQKNGT